MAEEEKHYGLKRLRRGFFHFLAGKSVTAVLGFSAFLLTASVLPVQDYGAYVTLVASIDLAVAMTSLGIDWVAVRFVPEYRACGSSSQLRSFVRALLVFRFLSLGIPAATALVVICIWPTVFAASPWGDVLMLSLALLVTEGMARFSRDHLLDSLLRQGASQVSMIVRGLTLISLLAFFALASPPVSVTTIVRIELVASVAGLITALFVLLKRSSSIGGEKNWMPPKRGSVMRLALNTYGSVLIALLYGPQVIMLVATSMLGLESAAVFGFARNMAEQVKRYLPSLLFVGLVRPTVIARYTETRDFRQLNWYSSLIFKLSAFSLGPVIIFFLVFGQGFVDLVDHGKFDGAAWYVVGLLLSLAPFCHRQVLEMVINTLNHSELWLRAALFSLLTVPIALGLVLAGLGVWGLIAAVTLGELIGNYFLVGGLRRIGYDFQVDHQGSSRLLLAVIVTVLVLAAVQVPDSGFVWVLTGGLLSIALFLGVAWVIKPFTPKERALLNRVLPWSLFVW